MVSADDKRVVDAAYEVITQIGEDPNHTVAAAAMDTFGNIHTGENVYHFTGGLARSLSSLAQQPRRMQVRSRRWWPLAMRIGAPCGRCRQTVIDLHPDCVLIVPTDDGPVGKPVADLLPFTFRHPDASAYRLVRFDGAHHTAVRQGLKTAATRYRDPVGVGPALLIFQYDDGCRRLPGMIDSVESVRFDELTPDHAERDGALSVEMLRQKRTGPLSALRCRAPQTRNRPHNTSMSFLSLRTITAPAPVPTCCGR